MVDIRVEIGGQRSQGDLESLSEWLRGEDVLRGLVRPGRSELGNGEMGTTTDALIVAVGSGGTLTALATSLGLWLSRRGGRPTGGVRIELSRPDGTTVAVSADHVDDPSDVIRETLTAWVSQG